MTFPLKKFMKMSALANLYKSITKRTRRSPVADDSDRTGQH
ncbi:hypothetical protein APA_2345 [Pseudanabaena sp. lw0831]|nr:hypothetical protein APA_2345 [Pseudanabaena sp. lw0831]